MFLAKRFLHPRYAKKCYPPNIAFIKHSTKEPQNLKRILYTLAAPLLFACGGDNDQANEVLIYKSAGVIQCESTGQTPDDAANELINLGVDVVSKTCGYDPSIVTATQCGTGDNSINVLLIPIQNLPDAQEAGFELVSDLKDGFVETCQPSA